MSVYDLHVHMLEFAREVGWMLGRGWKIVDLDYGERKFSSGPTLILKRGDETMTITSPGEIEEYNHRESEKESLASWSADA